MLKKGSRFIWSSDAEAAFVEIKSRLSSKPVLRPPDYSLPFCVGVDAIDITIVAYLLQIVEGLEHPICFYSRRLSSIQQRYSTIEKEAYGLIMAVRVFRVYFGSHEVTVYTDHSPLQFTNNM